jgi:hypothetical protein
MRRRLFAMYGLPNAAPLPHETPFGQCREQFVDDDEDGRPAAYFVRFREEDVLL